MALFTCRDEYIITVINAPARAERNVIIAREASNRQKRNEIATGAAFCTEKSATRMITIKTIIKPNMYASFQLIPILSFKQIINRDVPRVNSDNSRLNAVSYRIRDFGASHPAGLRKVLFEITDPHTDEPDLLIL